MGRNLGGLDSMASGVAFKIEPGGVGDCGVGGRGLWGTFGELNDLLVRAKKTML